MNKNEIISSVAATTGQSKAATTDTINAVLATITDELAAGNSVAFIGFGTFKPATRAARAGVNPATGEKIQIPATNSVKFTVGAKLKAAVK